ncbi:glycoprotein [Streptomyces sp. 2-6]|uniref:glycoprotein n=1 Tax=Streptomyces sp. 2-6 TaxID=2978333 RepID=UPI003D0B4418
MARTDHEPAGIDAALHAAQALTDAYDDYDTDAALRRVTALADTLPPLTEIPPPADTAPPRPDTSPPRADTAPPLPGAVPEQASAAPDHARATPDRTAPHPRPPVRYRSVHEQAAHDLDLAVTLVVDAPQAHLSLARLVDHDHIEPEGALVFAALLHLAGYRDQAQFWFEFAAGAGNRTAAFCLYLLHLQRAEHRTAAYWRAHARASAPPPQRPAAPHRPQRFLLPEGVRRDLIRRCWRGRRPTLPPRLEAVIHSLPVDTPDEDFGEIPRPDRTLTQLPAQEPATG